MINWDYAELSHLAKEAGGPEVLIANIGNGGIATGRLQGGIVGALSMLVLGGVGVYLYQKKLAITKESADIFAESIKACGFDSAVSEEAKLGVEAAQSARELANGTIVDVDEEAFRDPGDEYRDAGALLNASLENCGSLLGC